MREKLPSSPVDFFTANQDLRANWGHASGAQSRLLQWDRYRDDCSASSSNTIDLSVRTHHDRKSFSCSKEPCYNGIRVHLRYCTRLFHCPAPDTAQHQRGSLERTQRGYFSDQSPGGLSLRESSFRIRSRSRKAVNHCYRLIGRDPFHRVCCLVPSLPQNADGFVKNYSCEPTAKGT